MNTAERVVDRVHPLLSAQLRLLKKRLRGDEMLTVIDALVRPGQTAVDIGANRGAYTLRLARLVGRNGRVHAVEPFPGSVAVLRRLHQSNVTVHPVALSDHEGHQDLYVPVFNGKRLDALASLTEPRVPHDTLTIQLGSLDRLLGDEAAIVQFVKCDAEGHELAVLRGGASLFARRPTLLIRVEERHQVGTVPRTFAHLDGLGYAGYLLREGRLHPLTEFDVDRDQLSFLSEEFVPYAMPHGYINNFLFLSDRADARPLLAE